MRVHRMAVLTTTCVAALVGCGGGGGDDDVASYCYSTDENGVVGDSVRPVPGYACIAQLIVEETAEVDSVRPVPGAPADTSPVRGTRGTIKLQLVRIDSLRRR